jgi:polyphenol oxidase
VKETNLTRRAFGLGVLAPWPGILAQNCAPPPHGNPTPAVIQGLPVIQRKAVSALTANEVNRLRLAYQRLRNLTASAPNDPRGWMQQANVHCYNCAGNAQGTDVHGRWSFLPWHRAYLFFHERILCTLLNDPTFRLPYWDWDIPINRQVPAIYRTPNTIAANSLFDSNRLANSGVTMPANLFTVANNPMNSANFSQFGGTANSGGSMENGIHGAVHIWTAQPQMNAALADMGRLNTAARDPIFYAHHGNIDRLWAEWIRRDPANHKNPTSPAFLNQTFTFFDQSAPPAAKWVSIRASDVLNPAALGYSYPPGAGLSSVKPMSKRLELSLDTSKRIQLTAATKSRLGAAGGINVVRALIVEGVKAPGAAGMYFIFAGEPPTTGDKTGAANYVGYLAIPEREHVHSQKTALVLEPAKGFIEAARGNGTVLTIVSSAATGAAARGTPLEYDSVHMLEE